MLKFYIDKSFDFRKGTKLKLSIIDEDPRFKVDKYIKMTKVELPNDCTELNDDESILFLHQETIQDLLNQLYNMGFRPSDEVDKNTVIEILKDEISKRDNIINNLMERFVFKTEVRRTISPK